jgi:translation initiation factor IF-1
MPRANAIEVEGVVVEVLTNKTYRVELANGHRLLGFVAGQARLNLTRIDVGNKVKLELSPCDLSEGRILVEKELL